MSRANLPTWVVTLDEDDLQMIRRFVLASGSLKEVAEDYGVSYPTIRLRIEALIERMKVLGRNSADDVLEAKLRLLVAEGAVTPKLAKELLSLHRETKGAKG